MSRRWLFAFFLVSGFCSLLYEIVWLRLAMAQFGVTTALVSVVLSVFMGGLALGSWVGGMVTRRLSGRSAAVPLQLYAIVEVLTALSATAVPAAFAWGRSTLVASSGGPTWGSGYYHLGSAAFITAAMLPFCFGMGATLPLGLGVVRKLYPEDSARGFSYLYVANLLGATSGTIVTAFVLIERLGFRGTLAAAAALNAVLAAVAFALSLRIGTAAGAGAPEAGQAPMSTGASRSVLVALFTTGLASMAMEVAWIRQLTPYLGTVVYSFSSILALYLLSNAVGSSLYRRWSRRRPERGLPPSAWAGLALLALLPLIAADPRLPMGMDRLGFGEFGPAGLARAVFGIVPFCAALGFVTPLLLDQWSKGEPRRAGIAYACNVVGCILGPIVAGFALLPALGERASVAVLAATLLLTALLPWAGTTAGVRRAASTAGAVATAVVLGTVVIRVTRSPESLLPRAVILRDETATVVASGEGLNKQMLVNGIGMTHLTPITKMMAHLPLAFRERPPDRGLVLCFGMGTSYRSMMAWGIDTTAVELVPSVAELFGEFHADAAALVGTPRGRIIIDDGRRFLERASETYDVIVIDPPPPMEAAGSSLLYSREFYAIASRRLSPGGILQQWIPGAEPLIMGAATNAVLASFPHVRVYGSIEGWGLHLLASNDVIPEVSAATLAARLPPAAAHDLVEWGPNDTPEAQFASVLGRQVSAEQLQQSLRFAPILTDDRPFNEYFLLRRILQ